MPAPEKIKIFVDAHAFDKEHQGTRSYIKRLYTELAQVTDQIELWFGARNVDNLKREFSHLPHAKFLKYKTSSSFFRLFIELPILLRVRSFDFAHFQYVVPFFCRTAFIVTTHDVLFLDFPAQFPLFYRLSRGYLFRRSLNKSTLRTTVSGYSAQRIVKKFGLLNSQVIVLPSGVDHSFFEPYEPEISKSYIRERFGASDYILCVSRFEPRKNHELLLKTYLRLELYKQQIYLVLVGHSSMPTSGFSNVLQAVPDSVRQYILVNHKAGDVDLYHFYRGARVFVYPSVAEGFGLPPIEAGALRIPVICSDRTAMADYTFFGRYHVDPHSAELFTDKLQEIVANPPSDEELKAISSAIRDRYTFRKQAQKLAAAIQNLSGA